MSGNNDSNGMAEDGHWMRSMPCIIMECIVACLFWLPGCSHSPVVEEGPTDSIRSVSERGPVRVIAEIQPANPRLSDEPTFTLTYEFEKGVVVNKPPFGKSLGEFEILGFREPPGKLVDNRRVEQQVYRLEPTTAGEIEIAPIKVTFRDGRKQVGDQQLYELLTEQLIVPVSTMVGDEAPSLVDLRPPAPPVPMPVDFGYVWLAWLILPLFMVSGLVWWWRRRQSSELPETIYSPREIAQAALRELENSNLASIDVKRFYVELTGIVRRYLEQTSGVRAPEQTTEEFLRDIADHTAFAGEKSVRLQHFLESADLVKFAGYQPSSEDVTEALQRARRFVETSWSAVTTEVVT